MRELQALDLKGSRPQVSKMEELSYLIGRRSREKLLRAFSVNRHMFSRKDSILMLRSG
jgi:hypothetical protein